MRSTSITLLFLFFFFLFTGHFSQTAANHLKQTFHTHAPRPGLQSETLKSLKSVGGVGVGVKMSKMSIFEPTLLPQTPTPQRNGSAYQNSKLTWRVPTRQQQLYKNPFSGGGGA